MICWVPPLVGELLSNTCTKRRHPGPLKCPLAGQNKQAHQDYLATFTKLKADFDEQGPKLPLITRVENEIGGLVSKARKSRRLQAEGPPLQVRLTLLHRRDPVAVRFEHIVH